MVPCCTETVPGVSRHRDRVRRAPHRGTPADVAVSLERVDRTHGGDQPVVALDDVSAVFMRGTATAVMGPSGSGKRTPLHRAAGLDRPDSGRVRIGATDLSSRSERRLPLSPGGRRTTRPRRGRVRTETSVTPARWRRWGPGSARPRAPGGSGQRCGPLPVTRS
ncbi:ATP-binding cassette domain-containing protein [Streptomyces marokkonensis]|uniref:ATP-binding cassette domain-containing protein n=1 Tax=Streptomyces marokkonensis TaxID=324855 RepID=A0ABW6Q230_9ACTN